MTTEKNPLPEEPAEQHTDKVLMNARQRELYDELMELDSQLAGLYHQGLRFHLEPDEPGNSHLLGYVGRELTLGVVAAVLDEGWSLSERELAEIPDNERYRKRIARSLRLPPSDRRVKHWFELHSTFVGAVHYRRGERPPDVDVMQLSFTRLEQLLYGRIGPYFGTRAVIDELLAISEPDKSHIERLQPVLLRFQQRRYFFGKLDNAAWLSLLDDAETFDRPPERLVHSDGSWSPLAWPEGEFLARVATSEPEHVLQILERLPADIENPVYWRVVTDVANQLPASLGFRLVPRLSKALGTVPTVIFGDRLLSLISHLANANRPEAFDLAASLLFIPSAEVIGNVNWISGISDWLFPRLRWTHFSGFTEKVLPSLEQNDSERTLKFLLGKLNQIAAVTNKLEIPQILSPQFRASGHPKPQDVAMHLFEATSISLERRAIKGPEDARCAIEVLLEYKGEVFDRLRYRLLAAAGQFLPEALNELLSSCLTLERDESGREIPMLVREQFWNASNQARKTFRDVLFRGPALVTATPQPDTDSTARPTPDVEGVKRQWQRRHLLWFRGKIPHEFRELAEDLGVWDKIPSIEDQNMAEIGFHMGQAGFWQEPKPFTSDDLNSRSPNELAQMITDWKPRDKSSETGTTHGFELSIQELAVADPLKAIDVLDTAKQGLPSKFVGCLLIGVRESMANEAEEIPWDRLLLILNAVVGQTTGSEETAYSAHYSLLRAISDLLEEGLRRDLILPEHEVLVWDVLNAVSACPFTWEMEEEEFDSFDSLLSAAINRTSARFVSTTLRAGLWTYRLRKNTEADDASCESEKCLAPILSHAIDQPGSKRITSETAIGEFLPQLLVIAPKWTEDHLAGLLRSGSTYPLEHPVWGTYITRCHLYDSTFTTLRQWYVTAAEDAGAPSGRARFSDDHWSLTGSLAEHVLGAFLRGLVVIGDADELIETVFSNVPIRDRRHAYWSVFRGWTDADETPPQVFIDRLLEFWDWRLKQIEQAGDGAEANTEAEELGWFLQIPHIGQDEFLRFGLRTALAANGNLELHIKWNRMCDLAVAAPDGTYDILELVLDAQLAQPDDFISTDEVKPVFRVILDSAEMTTCTRARRLINRLGEAGYGDFHELLT